MIKSIGGLLAAVLISTTAVAGEKWDMPMAYSASNMHSKIGKDFAARVTKMSDGKLEIVTHPGGSLVGGSEIFRAVRSGQVPIAERIISALGNEDPLYEVDSIPFIATSYEDARRLYDATRPALEKKLKAVGLKLLYTVPWPPQGFYSKRPLNSATDMKNVKFRAYNAATAYIAKQMGAIPVKIEEAEAAQAFATGAAETMISSSQTGVDRKMWDYANYFYDIKAWLPKNMVVVNIKAWDTLDKATQNVVLTEAKNAEVSGWKISEKLSSSWAITLAKNGMNVSPGTEQFLSDYRKIGQAMLTLWLERAGDEGAEIMKSLGK